MSNVKTYALTFHMTDGTEETVNLSLPVSGGGGSSGGGGADGITPHIGDNGNWFIGETDTGVKAQGESGVYVVGNGERPASCRVQIDPSGDALAFDPDPATDDMTQPVGVTKDGKFVTKPTVGGGTVSADWEYIGESTPDNQLLFESGKYSEFYAIAFIYREDEALGTNNYLRLCIDGVQHLPWNHASSNKSCAVYGIFNSRCSISCQSTSIGNMYPNNSMRGNATLNMSGTSTQSLGSLGTCFWLPVNGIDVITNFGIKLWGRK